MALTTALPPCPSQKKAPDLTIRGLCRRGLSGQEGLEDDEHGGQREKGRERVHTAPPYPEGDDCKTREGPDGLPRPGEEDDESRNPGIVAGPGQKGTESRGILGQNGRTQARAQWDTETIRHSIEGQLNKPIVHLAGEEGLPSDAIVVDALVLQRQFREGCGVMPAWRRGA